MADRNRSHITVPASATKDPEPFTPVGGGGEGESPAFSTGRSDHGHGLKSKLVDADATAKSERPDVIVEGALSGIYVTFESWPGFELALTSLEPQVGKSHPEVRAVTTRGEGDSVVQLATVFVPDGWVSRFVQKFEDYVSEDTAKGRPKNRNLVERIADLRLSTLEALWTEDQASFPSTDAPVWWELWLRRREGTQQRMAAFAEGSGLVLGQHRLIFEDRIVLLARGTVAQLGSALRALDDLAEIRRPAVAASDFSGMPGADQAEFVHDLHERIVVPDESAPAICLLDTGVSQPHPLISPAMEIGDQHACDSGWGTADSRGHGTAMAGVALYPDLGEALLGSDPVALKSHLESVKVLPDTGNNDRDLYAAITAQAVSFVEIAKPQRRRSFVLAVTDERTEGADLQNLGKPTAWSAAIDAISAGRQVVETQQGLVYLDAPADQSPRLFLISAGNVRRPFDRAFHERSDVEPVEDPAQSWNGLSVGAFTQLDDISAEPIFAGWAPLAQRGELSPFSRTSVGFDRQWPHKPEIVLEGGNAATSPEGSDIDTPAALQVLTTRALSAGGGLLTTAAGTSPATAAAARVAAEIQARYPHFWPETVRGLMVHSARWTEQMLPGLQADLKRDRVVALRRFGWGVPNVDRALRSADDAVTLVSQNTIRPYEDGKMREMNIHDLPWPVEVLADLGDAEVRMRVALSYFIEPNPARRGWDRRFRYASHGLRFDVRRPTESVGEFRKRLNKLAVAEDEKRPDSVSDTGEWLLGARERVRGSLHVDDWTGTAADLAARGSVAIFPVTGWWKEQPKRDQSADGVRYSLIISIESPEVDVDLWTPVAVQAGVPVEIAI